MNKNIQVARKLLGINQKIILECEKILRNTKKHKLNCNIAKSVGAGVAIIGTGLSIAGIVVATVATGGVALAVIAPVLGWTGFGVGVAGSVTTGGTEIANAFISSDIREEIEGLQQKLRLELSRAPAFPSNIIRLQEAESSIKGAIFDQGVALVNHGNRFWAATGHLKTAVDFSCNGGFRAATGLGTAPAGKIICTCITKSPLLRASVISLIATGVELYFLYQSWTKPHALEKVIQDLIVKIQAFNVVLQWFIDGGDSKSDLPDLTAQDYEFQSKKNCQ